MRSESGKGSARNSTPSTALNIALLAPIPSASAATAARVKEGLLDSVRGLC